MYFEVTDITNAIEDGTFHKKYNPETLLPEDKLLLQERVNEKNENGETPLIVAAKQKPENLPLVECLLGLGANIAACKASGVTALMVAVLHKNMATAELLIRSGADVDAIDKDGDTALMMAISKNAVEMVSLLMQYGAKTAWENNQGKTNLDIAKKNGNKSINNSLSDIGQTLCNSVARPTNPVAVQKLLSAGAQINYRDESGNTPLILSARANPEITELLLEQGATVDLRNESGQTALMKAVLSGSARTVKILIDAGADVNARDDDGDTPLILSALSNDRWTTSILINEGADLTATNKDAKTALMIAIEEESSEVVEELSTITAALKVAIEKDDIALIRRLVSYGASLNKDTEPYTIALIKLFSGDGFTMGKFNLLIENGADINGKDGRVLHTLLCNDGFTREKFDLLIGCGADINEKDRYEDSLLYNLLRSEYFTEEKLSLLIKHGADINQKNRFGDTLLMQLFSIFPKHLIRERFDLLIANGADVNARNDSKETPIMQLVHCLIETLSYRSEDDADRDWEWLLDALALLIKLGANINAQDDSGRTALMRAIIFNSFCYWVEGDFSDGEEEECLEELEKKGTGSEVFFVVDELLKNGADINISDNDGETALLHALDRLLIPDRFKTILTYEEDEEDDVYWNDEKVPASSSIDIFGVYNKNAIPVISKLLALGADVNAQNLEGTTAIMMIASMDESHFQQGQREEIVELLLSSGANPAIQDSEGKSGLMYAKENLDVYKTNVYWRINDAFYNQPSK